jgi:hypothetical protein
MEWRDEDLREANALRIRMRWLGADLCVSRGAS